MLVYGDHARPVAVRDGCLELDWRLAAVRGMAPGIGRHGALVTAFVLAAELAQGIADAEFAETGADRRSPAQDAASRFLTDLAGAVWSSWRSAFANLPPLPDTAALRGEHLPQPVTARLAEGFAFYALYPEGYAQAAAPLAGRSPTVIGIRSIGVGLAAMVAAGAGAGVPLTVRPIGHPFARELALSPGLRAELAGGRVFAVADEGPGLSGSSFGAVLDVLTGGGVSPACINVFPSHRGDPGGEASTARRASWRTLPRHVVDFEQLVLRAENPAQRLEAWVETLVGPLVARLDDVSGGAWRALRTGDEAAWPPSHTAAERRKFLAHTRAGTFLVKFAGLGPIGERRLALARALGEAGFSPRPVGLAHGFLVERWHGEARRLDDAGGDRAALVAAVGRYLAFRAEALARRAAVRQQELPGASLVGLLAMAVRNTSLALGDEAAARLGRWRDHLPDLAAAARPTLTDNRLHAWEWLVLPDGGLLKSDAVDHFCAHDLVGCQDVAWDLVGAEVELGLGPAELLRLRAAVGEATGRRVEPELIELLRPCYLAFQLGAYTLASAHQDPAEAARLGARAAAYGKRLAALLR